MELRVRRSDGEQREGSHCDVRALVVVDRARIQQHEAPISACARSLMENAGIRVVHDC